MNPKKELDINDVETLRDPYEIQPHWEVRREFILLNKDKFDDLDRIICLSKCFVNIELLGCKYNDDITKLVKELGSLVTGLVQKKFEVEELPEESPKRKQVQQDSWSSQDNPSGNHSSGSWKQGKSSTHWNQSGGGRGGGGSTFNQNRGTTNPNWNQSTGGGGVFYNQNRGRSGGFSGRGRGQYNQGKESFQNNKSRGGHHDNQSRGGYQNNQDSGGSHQDNKGKWSFQGRGGFQNNRGRGGGAPGSNQSGGSGRSSNQNHWR